MYMEIYSFIFIAHKMQQLFFSASMQRTEYYSRFPKMKQTIYLIQYCQVKIYRIVLKMKFKLLMYDTQQLP